MKYYLLITILFSSLYAACQENETNQLKKLKQNDPSTPGDVLRTILKQDFKEDFIYKHDPGREKGIRPVLGFKYDKLPFLKGEEFAEQYLEFKNDVETMIDQSGLGTHSGEVQHLSLMILRKQLLDRDDDFAKEQARFLMDLLVEYKAIDLDVLVDTYLKIESEISEDKKEQYFSHMKKVYHEDEKYLLEHWEFYRDKYKEVSDPVEKQSYLMNGKHMERMSKAMEYARNLLPGIEEASGDS